MPLFFRLGKFQYTVMLVGLKNLRGTFARYILDLFRDWRFRCFYLEDILVFSDSIKQLAKQLRIILKELIRDRLMERGSKCPFFETRVQYFGHIVSQNRIQPVQKKNDAIKTLTTPKTVKKTQRFLGMANYYSRLRGAHLCRPIIRITFKRSRWGTEQYKVYHKLKSYLMNGPILVY